MYKKYKNVSDKRVFYFTINSNNYSNAKSSFNSKFQIEEFY